MLPKYLSTKTFQALAGIILILALGACSSGTEPVTGPDGTLPSPPPQAVLAAADQLSQTIGVPVEEIEILDFESMEWPDSCLGVPEEGQSCLQVITEGYRVQLEANGQPYEMRTDQDGTIIVQVP
jgi:hypothetical protein